MKRTMAITAIGVVLVIGACGGGETRLSKDEFLKQANARCDTDGKLVDAAFSKAFPNGSGEADAATVKTFVKATLVPLARKTIDGLDALKPPADLQGTVDTFLAHARVVIADLDKRADTDATALFSSQTDPFDAVYKEAQSIGLTACDNGNDSSSS
ncbi:MAG: hypothetical protein QOI95_751 [Acidimicrobiaceae bacterium]|jgi:hypothetical protein